MIAVKFQNGVELPEHNLWLDPRKPKQFAFVSHAHSDHIGAHREILMSARTARLMRSRIGGYRTEHLLEFGETRQFRDMHVTLLPAGHIFGSAQIHVESNSGSLLYTGDFKLRHGFSAEPIEWRPAKALIIETTYGRPKYRFPPTADVISQMIAFCLETLEDGGVPVLFGYSLGKSQEIICALASAGLVPMLHSTVFRMTEIYRQLQPGFPAYEAFDPDRVQGKILIFPPNANSSRMLLRIPNRRTALLSGWALDSNARYWARSDAAFPLSDHADYDDLIRYVDLVNPERVFTLHGFAAEFARDLRARGVEAFALNEENQLELDLGVGNSKGVALPNTIREADSESEFGKFAKLAQQIARTSARSIKVELLKHYLHTLGSEELAIVVLYFTGRAFSAADARSLSVGWAVIRRALLSASGYDEPTFRQLTLGLGDAGKATKIVLEGRTAPESFSLVDSQSFYNALETTRGPISKSDLLCQRLRRLTAIEAEYLVRIITGDLRIGLKEGLIEEAIATACNVEPAAVREAHMLLGDIGKTARLARKNALGEATLTMFCPVKCMLATPEHDGVAVWTRASSSKFVWLEDKYDGIRAQLHHEGGRSELYSRDLHCITEQFPELAHAANELACRAIFDGEIIAYERGRKLTFYDLQKRLGRTTPDLFLGNDIPVHYIVFDILALNGISLIKSPLIERRQLLETIALPKPFERICVRTADSPEAIQKALGEARQRGNEGLIVKQPFSIYKPGRRDFAWIKLKRAATTLDVIVVGAEQGHGKRSDVLSDYTFAIRHDQTGELLSIGKAYTGLTDSEIEELTEHFMENTLQQRGRFRVVRPRIVLEVAFDQIRPSKRHPSGLALRFPRIKAIRRDKSVDDIDTLSYAEKLAKLK